MRRFHFALLLLGVAFLGFLVWLAGPGELWRQLRELGWGLVPLILSEGVANLLHAAGWRSCLGEARRRVRLRLLFRMSLAGYAINYLTPTASLGGEVTKVALLRGYSRSSQAVSSVLLDKLSLAVAHLLLVLVGLAVVLWRVALPKALLGAMAASSALVVSGMAGFLLLQKHGKLGGLLRWLAAGRFGGARLESLAQKVSSVDETLKAYYRERPADLVRSVAWHGVGHSVNFFQVWLFLSRLQQPVEPAAVVTVTFLGLWFDLLTFALPSNIGGLEGSRVLAFKAVGLGLPVGMAFGVAVRLAQLSWAILGLGAYASLARGGSPRAVVARTPFEPGWGEASADASGRRA